MFLAKLKIAIKNMPFIYKLAIRIKDIINEFIFIIIKKQIYGYRNQIINNGTLRNVRFKIIGNNNRIEIGKETRIENLIFYIYGNNHSFLVGNNCYIKGGSAWYEDEGGSIIIGNNTTIENAHLALTEYKTKIIIGNDCMFSSGIDFRTGDSHSIIEMNTKKRINYAKDIIVMDHVWIGADVKVLKGVTIHKESIIATGSIVTSDIPENCIGGGIPAKVLKSNVNWLRERIY